MGKRPVCLDCERPVASKRDAAKAYSILKTPSRVCLASTEWLRPSERDPPLTRRAINKILRDLAAARALLWKTTCMRARDRLVLEKILASAADKTSR